MSTDTNLIENLAQEELYRAKFGIFRSPYEGYAIIKLEIDELIEEVDALKTYEESFWRWIKNDDNVVPSAKLIYDTSINIICQAIQVAAVAKRFNQDCK